MPLYEYECLDCGEHMEILQRVGDRAKKKCPDCGGRLRKAVSAPAFQFKGSGWYVTDYAGKKSGKDESKSSDGDQGASAGKDASKSSESKSSESKSKAPKKTDKKTS